MGVVFLLCYKIVSVFQVQDLVNLQETKKQLETDREKHLQELQEFQDGLAPLQEVLKGKQEAKNETVKKYRYYTTANAKQQFNSLYCGFYRSS